MNESKEIRNPLKYLFFITIIIILSFGAVFNIYINYLGKNNAWDFYPYAEVAWVILSILITIKTKTFKGLLMAVIAFQFLDSFVDLVAMGHDSWWAGAPFLIEWQWNIVDTAPLLRQYWFFTWSLQVPIRSLALAMNVSNFFKKESNKKIELIIISFIFAGLSVIWISSPQDFLFYFIWYGLYDPTYHYFFYLDPQGTWNFWNMLLFRVPIGIISGAAFILLGRKILLIQEKKRINQK